MGRAFAVGYLLRLPSFGACLKSPVNLQVYDRPSLKITTKHEDFKTPSKALFTGDSIHP